MRVLVGHDFYQQRGGEDAVFAAEVALLRAHGHEVRELTEHNRRIDGMPKAALAARTVWSRESHRAVTAAISELRPDVAHFHNTFPLLSPSVHHACAEAGVPVVQTLHNYRLLCLKATLYRDGRACESCLGAPMLLPGIAHRCYRGSLGASALVAATLTAHRVLGTWSRTVDAYIALTEFSRDVFARGGLPAERLHVKPNMLFPEVPRRERGEGDHALFVGRVSEEKGIGVLVRAWQELADIPLRVVGDGPLREPLRDECRRRGLTSIEWAGELPPEKAREAMLRARFLLLPSLWYEGHPMTIVEAFASGLPVVASDIGSMTSLIRHGVTGWLVPPGDARAWTAAIRSAWAAGAAAATMREACRSAYEAEHAPGPNHRRLMEIYATARARRGRA